MMSVKRSSLSFLFLLLGVSTLWAQSQSPEYLKYIDKFKDIAIQEMERAGVPASIKLAQGILESNAGQSYLARRANNHFGIKCGGNWNGRKVHRKDDDYNSRGKLIESCFRSYRTVEACYVAHSEFLRDPKKHYRYGFLFQLDHTDYRRWAHGLKKAGYATSSTYANKLIDIIERYDLHKFDRMSTIDLETPGSELIAGVVMQTNDVKYTLATPQETVAEIAERTDIAMRKLISYNEHLTDGGQVLSEGEKIYLQRKRSSYRGKQKTHTVAAGETMIDIANHYGLRLDKLYKRNRMHPGQQPAFKAQIKLRGGKVKITPKLRQPGDPVPPTRDEFIEMEDDIIDTTPPRNDIPSRPATGAPIPDNRETTRPSPSTGNPPVQVDPPAQPQSDLNEDPFSGDTKKPTTTTTTKPKDNLPPPVVITRPSNNNPPPPVVEQPSPNRPATTTPSPAASYHTVVKGDTLWNISQRFGLTVDALKRLNGLNSNVISIGQQLRVR